MNTHIPLKANIFWLSLISAVFGGLIVTGYYNQWTEKYINMIWGCSFVLLFQTAVLIIRLGQLQDAFEKVSRAALASASENQPKRSKKTFWGQARSSANRTTKKAVGNPYKGSWRTRL